MKICSVGLKMLLAEMDIHGTANRCKVATFHCEHQNVMESM